MFKRQKQPETPKKPKRKLTAAEKREIRRIMEQARGDGKPHSAQDTLPCHHMNREDFVKRIEIAAQGDNFDDLRELYTQMLCRQLEQGNNGLVKSKLLILTIEANDIHSARAKFSRIMLDALNHFKTMGALAKALDGWEWLELLHGILHPDGERFSFDWDWLAPSGLHVKDFSPHPLFGSARHGGSRWEQNTVPLPFCKSPPRKWMTVSLRSCWIRTAIFCSAFISAAWIRTKPSRR